MSSQAEEKNFTDQLAETNDNEHQKPLISYSRDFLLSFSDLEVCKTLPSGFDRSLLSELEDFSHDRQRIPGNFPSNTFRRSEYGSSPPTRGDLTSQSRGIQGRWDSPSSGRTDKDSDSQSDWDREPGRGYGNQSTRAWQNPEHDGLLGSGSFPRPSGFAAGPSSPKARPNEPYQLTKSLEPYQPPRSYKAVPHGRWDTDAFNNETIASSEDTDDDISEEERKRRASFELMRMEQHRAPQDNQKSNPAKTKDGFDFATLVGESKDETGSLKRDTESDEGVTPLSLDEDPEKSKALAQRPLVPPSFASSLLGRGVGAKSVGHSHAAEEKSSVVEQNSQYMKNFVEKAFCDRGGQGVVAKSMNKIDQKIYAVKKVLVNSVQNYEKATSSGSNASVTKRGISPMVQAPREIAFSEIVTATENFADAKRVAELDFGTTYRGFLSDGRHILVKRLGMKTCPALRVRFATELQNLGRLRHRNLVQLRGWCTEQGEMLVVYDYFVNRLFTHMLFDPERRGLRPPLPWKKRYDIVKSMPSVVHYLHEEWDEQVVHRSITSSAVILDPDMNARLGSFALAEFLTRNEHGHHVVAEEKPVRGIFGYMSPEYVASGEATTMADVYSFGVVVLEIITGRMAVDFRRPEVLLVRKVHEFAARMRPLEELADIQLNGDYNRNELARLVKLGMECTTSDPKSRPSIAQIVRILDGHDEWFAEQRPKKESGKMEANERFFFVTS